MGRGLGQGGRCLAAAARLRDNPTLQRTGRASRSSSVESASGARPAAERRSVMPPPFPPIIIRSIAFTWVIAASVLAATVQAAADDQRQESPFVAVFIDAKTEKALGPFPYDRAVLAKAIDKSVASGARGVVLKLFVDKPATADGDRALVDAAKRTKVLVQARLDDSEKDPNPLPDRFALKATVEGHPLTGKSGWLPLPDLAAVAHDLGFVDYRVIDRMPVAEQYRGKL